jgi:steroid delta-isomerase-like uncharacterized protein
MSIDQNKAIYREFTEEVLNQKHVDRMGDFMRPDVVEHTPGWPSGLEGARQIVEGFFRAFPDLHITIEDIVAEDDKLVARLTGTGTHQGEFNGIPPTGKRVTATSMDMVRFRDGKFAEHWELVDNLGMLQQLGVIPEAAQAGV